MTVKESPHEEYDRGFSNGWDACAARAQPAQAGQVLSDEEMGEIINANWGVGVSQMARAIEQAVMAKRVPQWLPIETAPKDGTEILLSNGETVAQGNWLHAEPYIREYRDIDGRYVDQDEFDGYDGWIDQTGGMQPDPTHWMPLPPPPGIVGKEGA